MLSIVNGSVGRGRCGSVFEPRNNAVCGGADVLVRAGLQHEGLSPRVRGSPRHQAWTDGQEGSIPACAGEPISAISRAARRRVYPRVCGGAFIAELLAGRERGLSPRVRGSHDPSRHGGDGAGSIPACAGEPLSLSLWTDRGRVYPRVCGGATNPRPSRWKAMGLSPRVRGSRTPWVSLPT